MSNVWVQRLEIIGIGKRKLEMIRDKQEGERREVD